MKKVQMKRRLLTMCFLLLLVSMGLVVTARAERAPVTKLIINKKNYTAKAKKTTELKGKPFKGYVKYTCDKGCKLSGAWVLKPDGDGHKSVKVNLKKKIRVKKGEALCLSFSRKYHGEEQIYMYYYRT